MQQKVAHLQIIQGAIGRMSTNSFQVKSWSVALVCALIALAASSDKKGLALIAFIPVAVFWGLDGYFLWQERLYRALYRASQLVPEAEVDFSMDASQFADGWKHSWPGACLSITLIPFHMTLFGATVAAMLISVLQ